MSKRNRLQIVVIISLLFILVGVLCFYLLPSREVPLALSPHLYKKITRKTWQSFVPPGYEVVTSTTGDFNKDQIEDIALILLKGDKKQVDEYDLGYGMKKLLILFGDRKEGYKVSIDSDTAIYEDLKISEFTFENGILLVDYYYGATERTDEAFSFAYNEGKWELVWYEVHRAYNILTPDGPQLSQIYDFKNGTVDIDNAGKISKATTTPPASLDTFNVNELDVIPYE